MNILFSCNEAKRGLSEIAMRIFVMQEPIYLIIRPSMSLIYRPLDLLVDNALDKLLRAH